MNFTKIIKNLNNLCKIIKKFIRPIRAFTLTELIVVIAILWLLATIIFYSVNWFVKQARDVSRYENLNRIGFWIELLASENWKYPEPNNPSNIVFSWALLWTQWTFWDGLLMNIWKLSSKPVDLVSLNEFTYSLANDKKHFELWAVLESDEIMLNTYFSEVYAKSKIPVRSLVVWNYNWLTLSVSTGGLVYILWIPTILSYDIEETDIIKLIEKKTLAYKWYWNIAASYSWTIFQIDWWFDFDPSIIILYSWTYENLINNESEWIKVLNNVQIALHSINFHS
jgi:prepilin-type N-terminal cleavage/methylation domain-containing protein